MAQTAEPQSAAEPSQSGSADTKIVVLLLRIFPEGYHKSCTTIPNVRDRDKILQETTLASRAHV